MGTGDAGGKNPERRDEGLVLERADEKMGVMLTLTLTRKLFGYRVSAGGQGEG